MAGDCAIGSILNRDYKEEITELSVIPTGIADVELGDKVVKSGRTTELPMALCPELMLPQR
jgi:endonuclease G